MLRKVHVVHRAHAENYYHSCEEVPRDQLPPDVWYHSGTAHPASPRCPQLHDWKACYWPDCFYQPAGVKPDTWHYADACPNPR